MLVTDFAVFTKNKRHQYDDFVTNVFKLSHHFTLYCHRHHYMRCLKMSVTISENLKIFLFLNNAGCFSDTINKVGSLPDDFFTILNERNYVLV